MIPDGWWVVFYHETVIGVIKKERRDFLAKFGLSVQLPAKTTKIMVDEVEYARIRASLKEACSQ